MQIPNHVGALFREPVMILLGTRALSNEPEVGRAMGVRAVGPDTVDFVVSRWQWPATAENIVRTGALAATLSRPATYETYQLKGQAELADAGDDDMALAVGFAARMTACLSELGIAPEVAAQWFCTRDLAVARLHVEEIFVQTPGALAGQSVGTAG